MKNFSFLLLTCLIVAQSSYALFNGECVFWDSKLIPNADITDEQWATYEQGILNVYGSMFGSDETKNMFAKMKKVGRDVLEIMDPVEYLGHVFLQEQQLPNETIVRVGMFGAREAKFVPDLTCVLPAQLKKKYPQYDFACGCPATQMSTLGAIIQKAGFFEDATVADDPQKMMDLYGIDTATPGQYYWFRLKNTSR